MSDYNSSNAYYTLAKMADKLNAAKQELELYKARYEYVKSLNPETFAAVLKASADLSLSFDAIVDSWTNKQ